MKNTGDIFRAPLEVLYEDNHLIAVYKPAGLLVQEGNQKGNATDNTGTSSDDCLLEQVRLHVKQKYKKPGNVFIGLIHRLDRNVSGIVLFAKTSKGASRLSEQIRNHTVSKIYHAWVEGVPTKKSAILKHFLIKDEERNMAEVYDREMLGSLTAELSYEVMKTEGDKSLIKIILKTGRHHQIRAQLAHIGHPICGDVKYGSKQSFADKHIALSATELHFDLATKEERKIVTIPVPPFQSWAKHDIFI